MSKDNEFTPEEEKIKFPNPEQIKSNEQSIPDAINESEINANQDPVLDEALHQDDIENKEPNTDEVQLKSKPKKKSFFKRFTVYSVMTLLTLGIWPRFKPLRSGASGSWFIFALFLLSISLFLATERFFKDEFNEKMTEQFGESAVTIPEKLFFEDTSEYINYEKKYNDLSLEHNSLKEAHDILSNNKSDLSPIVKDLTARNNQINAELTAKHKEVALLEDALNKPPEAPKMAFVTFDELDSIVGCSSKYAERKKIDIFESDFVGKWVKMDLIISKIHDDKIEFKNSNEVPLSVDLVEHGSGYDLLVDDTVSITFTLTGLGSCDKPYSGINGTL